MCKLFRIYASQGEQFGAELGLPATDYELLDLMERLRLEPGQSPHLEILEYCEDEYSFDYLSGHLPDSPNLLQLNALAHRLAELDGQGLAVFEGFVGMDIQKGKTTIPLPRLINFAYSGDCCHVVEEAATDAELGRFLAENGFVPEAEDLSDEAFELLDFAQIGKGHRESDHGVFTAWGYVEQFMEPHPVNETMDFTLRKPEYLFRVGITHHPDAEPEHPGKVVWLDLPATKDAFEIAEAQLGAPGWLGTKIDSLDSPVPQVQDMVHSTEDIAELNFLAERLAALDPQELTAYKALLETTNCQDLVSAGFLAGQLDKYIFCPEYNSPSDVAKGQLHLILGEPEAELLLPHLDLNGYGEELLRHFGSALTPYGLLEKKDNTPIMSEQDQPKSGGMEMM